MKIYVCASIWPGEVKVVWQKAFTNAQDAIAFCNAENEREPAARCDFTMMELEGLNNAPYSGPPREAMRHDR